MHIGGDAAALRPLPLPARLPVTYTELVGTLNEQLITALEVKRVVSEKTKKDAYLGGLSGTCT